jgi:tRNA nucleotidyltransferase (CCA-adding enzyme)
VAGERVLAELERVAAAPAGAAWLAASLAAGLLRPWGGVEAEVAAPLLAALTPEQARERGFTAEEVTTALPLARLAAALAGDGLGRLLASKRLQQRCRQLRRWRGELAERTGGMEGLPEGKRLALQRDLEADLPALLLHLEPAEARAALTRWRDPEDPLFHPHPPLDGRQLQQELGISAGPALGRLLDALTLERAFGRLPRGEPGRSLTGMEREQVLQAAHQWLACEVGGRRD